MQMQADVTIAKDRGFSGDADSREEKINKIVLDCSAAVLGHYCDELSLGGSASPDPKMNLNAISSIISFTGQDYSGMFLVSFMCSDIKCICANAIRKAMDEVTAEELEDFSNELCNQIFGKIRTELIAMGLEPNMGIPTILDTKIENIVFLNSEDSLKELSFKIDSKYCSQEVESYIAFKLISGGSR